MLKTKSIILVVGTCLALFLVLNSLQSETLTGFKILGPVENMETLLDGKINSKSPALFQFKTGSDPAFLLMLDTPKAIKTVTLYWIKGTEPAYVTLEISDDLFTWKKGFDYVTAFTPIEDGNLMKAEISGKSSTGLFVRIVLGKAKSSTVKIAGLVVEQDAVAPLKIVRLDPLRVAENAITFRFLTDTEAIGSIRYGQSMNQLQDGPMMINFAKEHSVTIDKLLKGTAYWFVGIGQDSSGGIKYANPVKVKTAGIPLPLIRTINPYMKEPRRFRLEVVCNVETKIELDYGKDQTKLVKKQFTKMAIRHVFDVAGLEPETRVYYRITARDKFGNSVASDLMDILMDPENIVSASVVSGDFNYIGENLGPSYTTNKKSRLCDRDFAYMTGSLMSGNIFGGKQELRFDFNQPVDVSRIDLIWWGLIYSTSSKIMITSDGTTWTTITEGMAPDLNLGYPMAGSWAHVVTRVPLNKTVKAIKAEFPVNQIYRRFTQYQNIRLLEVYIVPQKKVTSRIVINELNG